MVPLSGTAWEGTGMSCLSPQRQGLISGRDHTVTGIEEVFSLASLDSSLKRMGLEYVDVFYHHRPDPETPLEETMGALSDMVRQGKALYVGISNYQAEEAQAAIRILRENKTPCLLHQPRYNMFERWAEDGLFELLDREGVGCICYSPLGHRAP